MNDAIYAAIMGAALSLGLLARRLEPDPPAVVGGLSTWQRLALVLGVFIGGALGAKLPYVLSDPEGAISGLAWLRDGRTITWGLPGAYLGVELAKWLSGIKGKTGDSFAIGAAVSMAVGRLGCFYAGCCYGQPTDLPWAVDFGDGHGRHPNQLYEASFHALLAFALYQLGRRGLFRFQRIKIFIMAYMAFRIFSELLRPEPRIALGFTFYQWSALAFLVLFAGLFWRDRNHGRAGSTASAQTLATSTSTQR